MSQLPDNHRNDQERESKFEDDTDYYRTLALAGYNMGDSRVSGNINWNPGRGAREAAPAPPSPEQLGYLSLSNLQKHDNNEADVGRVFSGGSSPNGSVGRQFQFPVNSQHEFLLQQLVEMGFDEKNARRALEMTNGVSIDLALAYLEEHENDETQIPFLQDTLYHEEPRPPNTSPRHNNNPQSTEVTSHNKPTTSDHRNVDTVNTSVTQAYQQLFPNVPSTNTRPPQANFSNVQQRIERINEPIKMVLVVRKDLKMSPGKVAAQCCHAAVGIVLDIVARRTREYSPPKRKKLKRNEEKKEKSEEKNEEKESKEENEERTNSEEYEEEDLLQLTREQQFLAHNLYMQLEIWRTVGEKKVILKCNSEKELLELRKQAALYKIPHHLVTDAGHTEIAAGSKTVLVLGPYMAFVIDKVTGKLSLYR